MPNWKKVIVSGSSAHINHVTASGNISGSATTTGSFGRVKTVSDVIVGRDLNITGDITIGGGDITLTGAATDIDLVDNNSSALSFDASGKSGILEIDTTNNVEQVKTSGRFALNREPIYGFNYLARQAEGEVSASSKAHTFTVLNATKTSNHPYLNLGSSQAYTLDGVEAPFLYLTEGHYKFDYSGASSHPLRFYFDAAKTTQYNPGTHVSVDGNVVQLKIDKDSPQILYYQCSVHGYMGWAIHTGQNSQG